MMTRGRADGVVLEFVGEKNKKARRWLVGWLAVTLFSGSESGSDQFGGYQRLFGVGEKGRRRNGEGMRKWNISLCDRESA